MSKETARTFRQLVRGLKPGDLREVGRYSQQETLYVQMYARSAEIYELTIEDGDVVADPLVRFEIVQGRVRPVVVQTLYPPYKITDEREVESFVEHWFRKLRREHAEWFAENA